jgi:peroxiredoxin
MLMPRSRFFYGLLVLLAAGLFLTPAPTQALPRAGQPAPDFTTTTLSGQTVSLENYRGRVLLINFFATWCPHCRESAPHIVEMNRAFGKQGLQILGLSVDDGERVRDFVAAYRIDYPVALAGTAIQTAYAVRSIPTLVVIDAKGQIVEIYRGFSDEIRKSLEQVITKLLAEK